MANIDSNGTLKHRSGNRNWLAHLLFFVSGCAALLYEMSWSRLVGLALGNTSGAAALVLMSYFTGLAVGQWLGGRLPDLIRPLQAYGLAEIIGAIWACAIPTLLNRIVVPVALGRSNLPIDSSVAAAVICFGLFLPTTIALGTTLPLIARGFATSVHPERNLTIAYGLNTFGGLIGIIAALSYLLVGVGVRGSSYLAAAIAALCGAIALIASRSDSGAHLRACVDPDVPETSAGTSSWLLVSAVSGFGILGIEILYMRMFALVFHNSSYTFGVVVAVFLLALSLGTFLATILIRWVSPSTLAAASFSLGGILLVIASGLFPRTTSLSYFDSGDTFASYILGAMGLAAAFIVPPVSILGMVFPAALQSVERTQIGRVSAANVFASACGALVAGMILLPLIGLWRTIAVFAGLFVVAGVFSLVRSRHRVAVVTVVAAAIAVVGFKSQIRETFDDQDGWKLVRRWETPYGWIDSVRNESTGATAIRQDMHYRHGSTGSADVLMRLGAIPLLLHPKPTDVAFLGLGTGMTASPAEADRAVQRVQIVEIIPQVVEAARQLTADGTSILSSPKVAVEINDARRYLVGEGQQFDVIVSDLFVPWESRAGYLYTAEFYQSVRKRLKPNGHFCQWIALYQLGPAEFEMIANTYASIFPHATLWWGDFSATRPMLALIGSEHTLHLSAGDIRSRMSDFGSSPKLIESNLRSPDDLLDLYVGDCTYSDMSRTNTDEHPWLEFSAPISHQTRQTLIRLRLEQFVDEKLNRLPCASVRFGEDVDAKVRDARARRASQRFSMFGD